MDQIGPMDPHKAVVEQVLPLRYAHPGAIDAAVGRMDEDLVVIGFDINDTVQFHRHLPSVGNE